MSEQSPPTADEISGQVGASPQVNNDERTQLTSGETPDAPDDDSEQDQTDESDEANSQNNDVLTSVRQDPVSTSGAPLSKQTKRALRRERRRKLTEDAWNLPNLLTYLRVAMIPLVLYLLDRGGKRESIWAAITYAVAGITDLLDGFLARKMNIVSVIGKFLDPLADKLMVMAVLVWMVALGRVPAWAVILLLARDISITALRSIASTEGFVIAAGEGGKQKTALQIVGIILLIIGYPYHINLFGFDLGVVDMALVGRALVYVSLILSFTSAAEYVALFARAVENKEKQEDAQ